MLLDNADYRDEPRLLALLCTAERLRNTVDHLIATTVATVERLGIPARKGLKTGADMLTAIGVAPATAHRSARIGRATRALPTVTRALRDGALSAEHADAVINGLGHITARVDLDDDQRAQAVTTLIVQPTPVHPQTGRMYVV